MSPRQPRPPMRKCRHCGAANDPTKPNSACGNCLIPDRPRPTGGEGQGRTPKEEK